ncbi:MAG: cytochrome c peroxidase [Bacteroidota bacterium]
MKHFLVIATISISIAILTISGSVDNKPVASVAATLEYFKIHADQFGSSTQKLETDIRAIEKNNPQSIRNAKESLRKCRLAYKKIEFFLSYFLTNPSMVYNQPPKFEVEEPFMEYREPSGLQVIESMLFEKAPVLKKKELLEQAALINASAQDLYSLLYTIEITDTQVLESIRLEIIRIMALGITGFDAPDLKSGIVESGKALESVKAILAPFLVKKSAESDSAAFYLDATLKFIQKSTDFDSFDRLEFLTRTAIPLQVHVNKLIEKLGLQSETTKAAGLYSGNLFSPKAISINRVAGAGPDMINLGKKLFFEKGLSSNYSISCASCHQPDKFLTDQLPRSIAFDKKSTVRRNAPTLLYASCQYTQFWDGRVKSMEDQVLTVLQSPVEMNADLSMIETRIRDNVQYASLFNKAFPGNKDSSVNRHTIAKSIVSFLQTLTPYSSPFDKYMAGDKKALTVTQIKGFNLAMGKAQCGTCHFMPLFNGLIPPLYNRTELEVLGTTLTDDFTRPVMDTDSGRFAAYPILYYMNAFKTPTMRNAAKTAPYMHNGAFATLEKVLAFYNKGGGAGMGLAVPVQTLSAKPLGLTDKEIKDIIAFLHSLTDCLDGNHTSP